MPRKTTLRRTLRLWVGGVLAPALAHRAVDYAPTSSFVNVLQLTTLSPGRYRMYVRRAPAGRYRLQLRDPIFPGGTYRVVDTKTGVRGNVCRAALRAIFGPGRLAGRYDVTFAREDG